MDQSKYSAGLEEVEEGMKDQSEEDVGGVLEVIAVGSAWWGWWWRSL